MARRISAKSGAPIIMTMHTDYPQYFFGKHKDSWYSHLIFRLFSMRAYRGLDTMTTPSEKARRLLLQYMPEMDVRVISNGIKLEDFRCDPTEKERMEILDDLGLSVDDAILVTVARLSKEKNVDELIRFFPKLQKRRPGLKFMIVGSGPYKKELERLAREVGIEDPVRFVGKVPHSHLARYYKIGKIFICASDYETQGLTYLESMACGIPALCRDDPALIGIISDGVNGFLYRTQEEFVEKAIRRIRK